MKKRRSFKIIFWFIFLIFSIISSYLIITFIESYIEWENNKDRLIENLHEYYRKIKNKGKEREYVILDEEGKIITTEPTRIYDANNNIIGEFAPTKREIVKFNEIPKNLINALITIEDNRFYKHNGIDIKGILRAFYHDIKAFKIVEGGSTITQQLAKILFTSRERTIKRKFLELFATFEIEKDFSKDDILLMYLNTVYLGHGIYGVETASKVYFNKDVRNLDIFESSLLVSIIPAPNYFSPYLHPDRAEKKHLIVLKRLKKEGLISSYKFNERFNRFWKNFLKNRKNINISYWKMDINRAPYIVEYVRQYLVKHFYVSEILQGGLKIYTTIDLNIQNDIRNSVSLYLNSFFEDKTNKNYYKNLQTAVVVLNPTNGDILGFVGGKNYNFQNQLNRAFKIRRQIGSTIKPLIYTYGIDKKKITLMTFFTDKRVSYDDYGRKYIPKNYDNKYIGRVTIEDALVKSINTVSVQLLHYLNPELFVNDVLKKIYKNVIIDEVTEKEADINFIDGLSLALGTVEMSPLEVGIEFSVIANGGHKVQPLLIKEVRNKYNDILINNEAKRKIIVNTFKSNDEYTIYNRNSCYIISTALKNVFKKGGTAYYAAKKVGLNIELSGKTGTTSGFKDAWCSGFTKDYVATVWVGFDNYRKTLGKGATGGRVAGPILVNLFNKLYYNKNVNYLKPDVSYIVLCDICKDTGLLATSECTNIEYNVPFFKGTEPTEYSP